MLLEIREIWSPDLTPASSGSPPDRENFCVFMQVTILDKEQIGNEVFGFTVCSPSSLAQTDSGTFVQNTLVLDHFSWQTIQNRLEKLLLHCHSCKSWSDVNSALCGYLRH
jgi:hypothetical protein